MPTRSKSEPKLPREAPILPDSVPVKMPDLPARFDITTAAQLRAIGDPTRERILAIIQQQPRTAKQLATQLGASTGSIGHQLRVLEKAGLAKVVARRMTRGIVAKYYTRAARVFHFDIDTPKQQQVFDIVKYALADLREALDEDTDTPVRSAYPRVRLSDKRAAYFDKKLAKLVDELLAEPPDPNGQTWSLLGAFFRSPRYVQTTDGGRPTTEDLV
jgi:DNA-binding transcriptional ArsR family regulator